MPSEVFILLQKMLQFWFMLLRKKKLFSMPIKIMNTEKLGEPAKMVQV